MRQANPDAGDPRDDSGKGIWFADAERIKGKWVEVTADHAHRFAGRLG